jgi:hypothetical protein
MTSSSQQAASPTASQEPPRTAPLSPPPIASPPPLATDTSSPHRSAPMEAGDGADGTATTTPTWFIFFFFFKMKLHVLKMWINAITCVQVVSVSDESCEIDIPTEDGIELLSDARNQYIPWHHRDIILNASPSPCLQPSQKRVPPRIQMLHWSSTQWVGNMEAVTMTTT